MGFFIPFSSFESRLFLARRLAGVPGYQYDVDMSKEIFQRQIFTFDEVQKIVEHFQMTPGHEYRRNLVFNEKMYLIDIKRIGDIKSSEIFLDNMDENSNIFGHYTTLNDDNSKVEKWNEDVQHLLEFLELKHPSELLVTEIDENSIDKYLNDRKFKELSSKDQRLVKIGIHQANMIGNRFAKPIYEAGLSLNMFLMGMYQNFNLK